MIDKKNETKTTMERALGRRKTATARVRLSPGKGSIVVNGKQFDTYFPTRLEQQKILLPLVITAKEKTFDITVKVVGGGKQGQVEAVRHGIARALIKWNVDLRPSLKAEGLLTRDPREKERKKFGLYRARRGHQWRKR